MMNEKENKKDTSQILKELGETLVAYELAWRGWTVSKNLGSGYDLHIRKTNERGTVSEHFIEVKTRDKIHSISVRKNITNFYFTQKEVETCTFAICHLYGENTYFILPSTDIESLPTLTVRGLVKHRFTVNKRKDGTFSPKYDKWLNKWENIK